MTETNPNDDDAVGRDLSAELKAIQREFAASLRSDAARSIEFTLSTVNPSDQRQILPHLIVAEIEFHAQCGEDWDLEEYVARFQLDAEDRSHLELILRESSITLEGQAQRGLRSDTRIRHTTEITHPIPRDGSVAGGIDETSRFRAGQSFGRYVLTRKLAQGGMGEVWQAFDANLDSIVALKFPLLDFEESDTLIAQFRKEAQALAKLFHPNICRIFDVDSIDGQWYIAMAYVRGESLEFDGRRSLRDILDIVRTVALALHEAHLKGIIHRDVKPSNVIIDEDHQPVVLDFGLAVHQRELEMNEAVFNGGTLPFMAPEQVLNRENAVGILSDVYGLGALLYSVLTNRSVFPVETLSELVAIHRNPEKTPDPPSAFRADIPPNLDAICLTALAESPASRFESMAAFADALQHLLRGEIASKPRIRDEFVRFEFMGQNRAAPENNRWQDRIFLDTGNRLDDGVIDHHQFDSQVTCATRLARERLDLVDAALKPWRNETEFLTLVTHANPDLDGVCAAYLTLQRTSGIPFPRHIDHLVDYVQMIDQGFPAIDASQPFGLYAAFTQRAHSLSDRVWEDQDSCWRQIMKDGIAIVRHVARELDANSDPIDINSIDAFMTPGIFRPSDRKEIINDRLCYQTKLHTETCHPSARMLVMPTHGGMPASVPFLCIRDVQDVTSTSRCLFFKEWARSDADTCPETGGFIGLCVHTKSDEIQGCIISVRPGDQVHLQGLGLELEAAEVDARARIYGCDNRQIDPETKRRLPNRPGYDNSDPWYDGRSHRYTIIGSPIGGTMLSEDEIENIIDSYYSSD